MTRTYALDATPLVHRPTGIGRFVRELVAAMAPLLGESERLLLHAGTARLNPLFGVGHEALRNAAAADRVSVRRLWLPLSLCHALWNRGAGPPIETFVGSVAAYHGTNFLIPPSRRARRIVTVHDLSILRLPGSVPARVERRFRTAVTAAVRRADVVVADSECTRRDVIELLGVADDSVRTIPLGVAETFFADGPGADPDQRPYLLAVGTTNPRKNVEGLLRAFALVRSRAALPHRLVLVGAGGFAEDRVRELIHRLGLVDAVERRGYVDDGGLAALYRGAAALVFPSLYEGFGLPVLEAMASGCPVLASDAASLPEVAGDAALLVDANDADALADGIERIVTDNALGERLRSAGRLQARRFPWKHTAEAYLGLYRG